MHSVLVFISNTFCTDSIHVLHYCYLHHVSQVCFNQTIQNTKIRTRNAMLLSLSIYFSFFVPFLSSYSFHNQPFLLTLSSSSHSSLSNLAARSKAYSTHSLLTNHFHNFLFLLFLTSLFSSYSSKQQDKRFHLFHFLFLFS